MPSTRPASCRPTRTGPTPYWRPPPRRFVAIDEAKEILDRWLPESALAGVRDDIEARVRDQLARLLAGMDLVSREEFEAVKAMAAKAREEQELLLRRVELLEARLGGSGGGAQPPAPPTSISLGKKQS